MVKPVIASLSEDGWVTDSKKILDYLLSYYILTDAAQTLIFRDNIISLPKTYYEYINDPIGLSTAIKVDLDKLLSYYFEHVEVTVEVKKITDNHFALLIYASVIDSDNIRYELGKVTEIGDSVSKRIINANNYGTAYQIFNSI